MTMILVMFFFVVAAAVLTIRQGSWTAPGPLLVGYWVLGLALPSLAGYPGTPGAAITIGLLILAWAAGSMIGSTRIPSRETLPVRIVADVEMWRRKELGWLMVASGLAGATAAYMTIRAKGFNLSSVLSLDGLFQVGNSASVQRYSTAPHQASSLLSLLLMVTFVGALAAPRWLLCSTPSRFRRAKAAVPILGATLYGAVSTARAAMVISAVLWAGSYLTSRSLLGRPVSLRMATVSRIVIGVVAGIILFLGIAYVRIGGPSAHGSQKVPTKVESNVFGYLPAFATWQRSLEAPSFAFVSRGERWGDLTFNGVTKLVTHNSVDDEPYPEFVAIDKQGNTTNIYTFFRGLIEDFGVFGAIIFMFLVGFIGARSYETMNSSRTVVSYVTTTVITSSILFSNAYSPFYFTNVFAAFLIDAVLIRILMTVQTATTSHHAVAVTERQRI